MQVTNEQSFLKTISKNKYIRALLERLPSLNIPDWYLVGGCLFQTVWNELSGYPPAYGIQDYDIFYCDCMDLSWEAEDRVIRQCTETFADLGVEVQIRNQARVHLWYEEKYGAPCPKLKSSKEGIDGFLNQPSCFGVQSFSNGQCEVYAPFGLTDLFDMIVRPNIIRNAPDVYYSKVQRWSKLWPKLKVLPWP